MKTKLLFFFGFLLLTSNNQAQTVTDYDGNVYNTVIIGTQVWMKENLKVTHYRTGDPIPNETDATAWFNLVTGARSYYNNDSATNAPIYGALYNWYAATLWSFCPTAWHVPTDSEWTTLSDYLTNNGYGYQGSGDDIAKSMAATSGWADCTIPGTAGNDQASNNSSGSSGLPGGVRHNVGTFEGITGTTYWWTTTEFDVYNVWRRYIDYNTPFVNRDKGNKQNGFSVRCLRDELYNSINENSLDNQFKIYPNPSSGKFTITIPSATKHIQISNSIGQIIHTKYVDKQQSIDFELTDIGIYVIQVKTDKQILTKKLVICR